MSDILSIVNAVASALPAAESADVAAKSLGKGLAYGIAAAGAGIGIGMVVAATLSGIARQPEQTATLRTLMFIGVGFIEVLALIGLALVFIM